MLLLLLMIGSLLLSAPLLATMVLALLPLVPSVVHLVFGQIRFVGIFRNFWNGAMSFISENRKKRFDQLSRSVGWIILNNEI